MARHPKPRASEDLRADLIAKNAEALTAAHLKLAGWQPTEGPSFAGGLVLFKGPDGQSASYRRTENGKLIPILKPVDADILRLLEAVLKAQIRVVDAEHACTNTLRDIAAVLVTKGFSLREAGDVIGYTGGRVHQLVGSIEHAKEIAGAL